VITDGQELEALRVLARTTRPLTGRDVARLAHRGSHSSTQRSLRRLVESGLVDVQEAGRARLYTLNREHVAVGPALALLGLREELLRRMSEAINGWEIAPVHASLFGSSARGDGDEDSDVDVFIIRPDAVDEEDPRWRAQLDELSESIRRWSGNEAALSEVSEKELRRLRRERPPIVNSLTREALTLAGPQAADLLHATR
jgi:predicted nucleotidyltransferase